ncbi:MAG: disulfide bond formation protein B [Burkholderiales bacterium]
MSADRWFAGIALGCISAVGAALVSQHVFDMQPCPWCVLQRVIFLAIALACVLGLAWRHRIGRRVGASVGALLALCGIGAALWQHFKAAASASCDLTLADKIVSRWLQLDQLLPDVFEPRASCADAAVSLLGVPYDFWSLALFVLFGAALLSIARARR